MYAKAQALNMMSNLLLNDVVLGTLASLFPRAADVIPANSFNLEALDGFCYGTESFLDSAAQGAKWSLGYAEESVLPDDFGTAPYSYARGSYVPWWYSTEIYADENGNREDLRVRTVVINDGSGRGSVAFSVVDCIGLANEDVRKIRVAAAETAEEFNIVSVNVSATHTHTGIDSQGVWTAPLSTLFINSAMATLGLNITKSGVNQKFLAKVVNSTAKSIKAACENMATGTLGYAQKNISAYTYDRTPPAAYDGNLYRLEFTPDDTRIKPTIIASFGCHPESGSYDWLKKTDGKTTIDTKVSADFVYYMEKVINAAGRNFLFIQGNVGTVTSSRSRSDDGLAGLSAHDGAIRYGYELGYITLGMTKTQEECASLNLACGDLLGVEQNMGKAGYSVWYSDWRSVEETAVEPYLNIRHNSFTIEIENNVAKLLSKTGLADITVVYERKTNKYSAVCEVGYMEIGQALKVFLCPGECFSEILLGHERLEGFEYAPLRELYGDNLIVFDLMNDAAGYMEPDNYYTIQGYQYNPTRDQLESDGWCLLVSFGKHAASDIVGKFIETVESVK